MSAAGETGPLRPPGLAEPDNAGSSRRWWLWVGGVVLFGVIVLSVGGLSGYASGLNQHSARVNIENSLIVQEQFDLGVQDLLEGRYELARQRFAYIMEIEPDNGPARELLGEALIALDRPTPTLTPTPSPTLDISPTPTLDLRSMDGLFAAAQTAHGAGDYDAAAEMLLTIIAEVPDFRRGEVNQLLFSVLRNRGLNKIWSGDQEQGIYDLTLAERLFPLDSQASSWRTSAAFYLLANSYFGLDWPLATEYFSQICVASIWDACWKYSQAAWEYGNKLVEAEDPCGAVLQYDASLSTREDAEKAPTATEVFDVCLTATAPAPTPTPSPTFDLTTTVTPSGTAPGPSPTPTLTATGGPSPTPTVTPTHTPAPTITLPPPTPG
ncbi:MAG: tetratricopeptide repeat protein [Chloroflexi bacterium]|nr:tetratricopeptide repeat protein [Chloroflexota bacterium]